ATWKPCMNAVFTPSSNESWTDEGAFATVPSAAAIESCDACWTSTGNELKPVVASRSAYSDVKMLPITATPSVPPASRVASLTADPTPAFAGGSTLRIDSVAGAVVSPSPRPISTIWPTMWSYDMNVGDIAIHANDELSSSSPLATTTPR